MLLSEGINGAGRIEKANGDFVKYSINPDFNGYIKLNDAHTEAHLFTNWEDYPGGMSLARLDKDANGRWNVTKSKMLDFSGVGGTWVNCFGTISPWNTPISSEELYFPETAKW